MSYEEEGEIVELSPPPKKRMKYLNDSSPKTFRLARMIPRMCLPQDHPLYEWSHKWACEVVCTSDEVYDDAFYVDITAGDPSGIWTKIEGQDVLDRFPIFDSLDLALRPKAMYVVTQYDSMDAMPH